MGLLNGASNTGPQTDSSPPPAPKGRSWGATQGSESPLGAVRPLSAASTRIDGGPPRLPDSRQPDHGPRCLIQSGSVPKGARGPRTGPLGTAGSTPGPKQVYDRPPGLFSFGKVGARLCGAGGFLSSWRRRGGGGPLPPRGGLGGETQGPARQRVHVRVQN